MYWQTYLQAYRSWCAARCACTAGVCPCRAMHPYLLQSWPQHHCCFACRQCLRANRCFCGHHCDAKASCMDIVTNQVVTSHVLL